MPMTPVQSSWIKGIGYDSDRGLAYMETHQGYRYRRPMDDVAQTYQDWVQSGSKGGYWWDFLADRNPPWERVGRIPLPKFLGYEGYQEATQQMQEYKTSILGTSRDPYSLQDLGYNPMSGQMIPPASEGEANRPPRFQAPEASDVPTPRPGGEQRRKKRK